MSEIFTSFLETYNSLSFGWDAQLMCPPEIKLSSYHWAGAQDYSVAELFRVDIGWTLHLIGDNAMPLIFPSFFVVSLKRMIHCNWKTPNWKSWKFFLKFSGLLKQFRL